MKKLVVNRNLCSPCLVLLMAFLLLMLGAPSPAAAEQWSTTQWILQCYQFNALGSQWSAENCGALNQGKVIPFYRQQLEASSQWLEGLGFKEPKHITANNGEHDPLRSGGDAFVAKLASSQDLKRESAKLSFASDDIAKHTYYKLTRTGDLYLRKGEIIAPGSKGYQNASTDERPGLVLTMGTPVHELFHGIQVQHLGHETYRKYNDDAAEESAWIFEGSAEAVMRAWLVHRPPVSGTSPADYVRYYSDPLADPDPSQNDDYDTADFWLSIGEEIGSREKIVYLKDILDDLEGVSPTRSKLLASVDQSLAKISANDKGLYDLYPRVIAHYATGDAYFRHVEKVGLHGVRDHAEAPKPAAPIGPTEPTDPIGPLAAVAAHAYRLNVQVPEGKSTELEVKFAADHPNLHLIVDGQRLDTEGAQRNVFRKPLDGRSEPYTFFVRAANVAEHAADTDERPYQIDFALKHPPEACVFVADVDGAVGGHFEGKATVGFDTGDNGRTARITDLTLESDGFNLKVGLHPSVAVGDAATAKGDPYSIASTRTDVTNASNEYTEPFIGPQFSGNAVQKMFSLTQPDDHVDIEVRKSDAIPWGDLPMALREYLADTMGQPAIAGHGEQVGDVSVKGVVRGQLSQSKLVKGLADKNRQIIFRARFNAQSEIYGCDYEGFPETMDQRMSQIPGDVQMPDGMEMPEGMEQMRELSEQVNKKLFEGMRDRMPGGAEQMGQMFDQVKEKMSEGMGVPMDEQTKKQVEEQLEQIQEQMKETQ